MSCAHHINEIRRYNLAKSRIFYTDARARTVEYDGSQRAYPGLRPASAWPGTTARTGPARPDPPRTLSEPPGVHIPQREIA